MTRKGKPRTSTVMTADQFKQIEQDLYKKFRQPAIIDGLRDYLVHGAVAVDVAQKMGYERQTLHNWVKKAFQILDESKATPEQLPDGWVNVPTPKKYAFAVDSLVKNLIDADRVG